jgi:hypothetical protein
MRALPIALAAGAVLSAATASGSSFARANLWLHLLASKVNYGTSSKVGSPALYQGEALELHLFLDGALEHSTAVEADWPARVSVELRRGSSSDGTPRPSRRLRCLDTVAAAPAKEVDPIHLGPGETVRQPCTLIADTMGMAPGRYALTVSWDKDVDDARFKRLPGDPVRELEFDLIAITNAAEALDHEIHEAERATFHGHAQDALARLAMVLSRHPTSVPARRARSEALSALGDLDGANSERESAAQLAEQGRDPLDISARSPAHGKLVADLLRGRPTPFCGGGR